MFGFFNRGIYLNNIIWYKLIISILGCQAPGLIGGIFTVKSVKTWYLTINKPSFNPPSWVFGPVWTVLYILMGISVYVIWKKSDVQNVNLAIALFVIQLSLNAFWSILFFGLKNPQLAFFEIIAMWVFILACIIVFFPISQTASYLLIPYLLWVSFAAFLNYSIWKLNS